MSTQPQGAPAPLPERPNLRHLKDEARDLHQAGGAASVSDAQYQVAKRYGFASWPKLKEHVETVTVIPRLMAAIAVNDLDFVRDSIREHPRLLNAQLPTNLDYPADFGSTATAVQMATFHGHTDMVRFLVHAGADVNPQNKSRRSLVHVALDFCPAVADFLIQRGGKIDIAVLANRGKHERLREILKKDPALARQKWLGPPLEWALWGGDVECVRVLIEQGAQVENDQGAPAAAIASKSLEIVGLLLDHAPNRRDLATKLLGQAIAMARNHPEPDLVRLLVENGGDPRAQIKDDQTALDVARAMTREPIAPPPWTSASPDEVRRRRDEVVSILEKACVDPR